MSFVIVWQLALAVTFQLLKKYYSSPFQNGRTYNVIRNNEKSEPWIFENQKHR